MPYIGLSAAASRTSEYNTLDAWCHMARGGLSLRTCISISRYVVGPRMATYRLRNHPESSSKQESQWWQATYATPTLPSLYLFLPFPVADAALARGLVRRFVAIPNNLNHTEMSKHDLQNRKGAGVVRARVAAHQIHMFLALGSWSSAPFRVSSAHRQLTTDGYDRVDRAPWQACWLLSPELFPFIYVLIRVF
jgi:hypothetical protein